MANLEAGPTPASLTGPVSRGDVETVHRNRAALAGQPEIDAIYVALSRHAVGLAQAAGLPDAAAAHLTQALADAPKSR